MGIASPSITLLVSVTNDNVYMRQNIRLGDKLTLAVRHRNVHAVHIFRENAGAFFIYRQANPPALEFARIIGRQCYPRLAAILRLRQKTGFNQHLKTVADAQNEPTDLKKASDVLPQLELYLVGQHFTGRDIVAIGEATGNDQYLVVGQLPLMPDNLVDVNQIYR